MSTFRFKRFCVENELSPLKVGTDAVLLGALADIGGGGNMLDVGTGTGVIALMMAQRCSDAGLKANIEAIDIDPLAALEASANFASSPWGACLMAENVALEAFAPEHSYDLIFSNPPYFDSSLKNPDARSCASRHTDSLSYREILAFAQKSLSENGRVALILPYEEQARLLREARSRGLFAYDITSIKTVDRKPFKRLVAQFSFRRCECPLIRELTLQDKGQRTAQFDALVEGFYL